MCKVEETHGNRENVMVILGRNSENIAVTCRFFPAEISQKKEKEEGRLGDIGGGGLPVCDQKKSFHDDGRKETWRIATAAAVARLYRFYCEELRANARTQVY